MTSLTKQQLAEGIMMNTLADLIESIDEGRNVDQIAYFTALFMYALSEASQTGLDPDRLLQSVTTGYSQLEADGQLPMACLRLIDPSKDISSEDYANLALESVIGGEQ